MFDISWGELVLIGMVALIVIGPKELPTVLRTMGQYMTKVRRMAAEFQGQFQEAMREAEFSDLKKEVDSLGETARNFTNIDPLATAQKEFESAFDDKAAETAGTPSGEPPAPVTEAEAVATPSGEPATASGEPPPAAPVETAAAPTPAAASESLPAKPTDLEGGRAA